LSKATFDAIVDNIFDVKMSDWVPAIGFTLMPFIGSTFGRVITKKNMDWYDVSLQFCSLRSVLSDVCNLTYVTISDFKKTCVEATKMGFSRGLVMFLIN